MQHLCLLVTVALTSASANPVKPFQADFPAEKSMGNHRGELYFRRTCGCKFSSNVNGQAVLLKIACRCLFIGREDVSRFLATQQVGALTDSICAAKKTILVLWEVD